MLGQAAGTVTVGVNRIQIAPGGWSTPAHEHGRSNKIAFRGVHVIARLERLDYWDGED